jgi:hypothetical protein
MRYLALVCVFLLAACSDPASPCRISADCADGEVCTDGACGPGAPVPDTGLPDADGGDPGDSDGGPTGECADAPEPGPGELIINEVLAAVPSGDLGDANQDGVRHSTDDEFIELVNVSERRVRVQGVTLRKSAEEDPVTSIATGCLDPGEGLVIFGGIEDGAPWPVFAGALVEISEKSLRLTNGGGLLILETPSGTVLHDEEYPAAENASVVRWPELEGTFTGHNDVSRQRYSAGTCSDGQRLASGCPEPPPACPGAAMATATELVLNEVLSAVPSGPEGDANGDGEVSATRDEFVELVNIGAEPVLVENFAIYKEDEERTRLKAACLQPGQSLVVFAGIGDGKALPDIPGAIVELADKSFSFRKDGNLIRVVDPEDVEVIRVDLPPSDAQSLTREVQRDPGSALIGHARFGGVLFSPGLCPGGAGLASGCPDDMPMDIPDAGDTGGDTMDAGDTTVVCEGGRAVVEGDLVINEVLANVPAGDPGDANEDGVRDATDDEFVEIHNLSGARLDLAGVSILVGETVKHSFSGCLEPDQTLVVFAGSDGALPVREGVVFLVSDRTFRMSNGGGTLTLVAADTPLDTITWTDAPAASLQRDPELSAQGVFRPHTELVANLFSPGTCANGLALSSGCSE